MKFPGRFLREPLVHFAAAGAVLFGAFALLRDPATEAPGEATIVVDRAALVGFLQYRANALDSATFAAALDAMTEQELGDLIDAFVREEVLYREARMLALEESDYIIRQRLVQKMRLLIGDIAARDAARSEADLAEFFAANRDAYAVAPWVTFTHVFFDADRRGERAVTDAAVLRDELNSKRAGFNDATGYGDRFPFLKNYVERTWEFVASHFGEEFAAALRELPASETRWQGPIRSAYGMHVVLITAQVPRSVPDFEQVRPAVERDFATQHSEAAIEAMADAIRDRYRVVIGEIRQNDR